MAQTYEWDEAKNRQNIAKHGIDFADARWIFQRPVLVRRDDRQDYREDRSIALGELDGVVIVMVFTRRGDHIRIISVRKANRNERKVYQERTRQQP